MTQRCRSCGEPLVHVVVDLGSMPFSNAYRTAEEQSHAEISYPLRAYVCTACWLVQLQDFATREAHFHRDYAYFSSVSTTWMAHARTFSHNAASRFNLGQQSLVVEVASNDGYLLRNFVELGIPNLGIDPAEGCAGEAAKFGVETMIAFFGEKVATVLAEQGRTADLVIANNVLAHVPDLNDFVSGLATLLKPTGTISIEFPHLLQLIRLNQFDTIYHEHYSYLSVAALEPLFHRHGLELYDVEYLSTHGGSLRLYVKHRRAGVSPLPSIGELLATERAAGLDRVETYAALTERAASTKRDLLTLLTEIRKSGKSIVGYGAPAKGNTLLNYCGIGRDLIDFTVDKSSFKQGHFLPGSGIPILAPRSILEARPDYVLILPWNIAEEVIGEWSGIAEWGGRFIVPIPTPRVVPE
jgi:SAM-dependent methyltransferase